MANLMNPDGLWYRLSTGFDPDNKQVPVLILFINSEARDICKFAATRFEPGGEMNFGDGIWYTHFNIPLPAFADQDHLLPYDTVGQTALKLSQILGLFQGLPSRQDQLFSLETQAVPGCWQIDGAFSPAFMKYLKQCYFGRPVNARWLHFPSVVELMFKTSCRLFGLTEQSVSLFQATVHNETGWLTLACSPAGSLFPCIDGGMADGSFRFSSTCEWPAEQLGLLVGLAALSDAFIEARKKVSA